MTPQISVTITPPGGAATVYTNNASYDGVQTTPTISQNFGRQGDTCQVTLVDEYSGTPNIFSIPVLSQIDWRDEAIGTSLFAGLVTDSQLVVTGPNRNEWSLQCTDYTFYADNADVQGSFTQTTVGAIVVALTNSSGSGITAALSPGGYVDPGPMIPSYQTGWKALSAAWKELAQLAGGAVPYGWYVDENLALHFTGAANAPDSGVVFTTDQNDTSAAGHMLNDGQFLYEWDATNLHNQVIVQGASTVVTAALDVQPTDTWQSDGTASAWPLRFTPSNSMYMTVGGVPQTVTSLVAGDTSQVTGWTVRQNAAGGWFLTAPSAPVAGQTISLWYNYNQPLVIKHSNQASQAAFPGPNGGTFSEYVSDTSLKTLSMALARADQELAEYSWPVERLTFTSSDDWDGWVRAGQLITVTNSMVPDLTTQTMGLSLVPFLVVQNTVNFTQFGYRQMQITAVRVGTTSATQASGPVTYKIPGALRNYTLADVLTGLYNQGQVQLDAEAPTGSIGQSAETVALSDSMSGTVSTVGNWDESTWGAFSWN